VKFQGGPKRNKRKRGLVKWPSTSMFMTVYTMYPSHLRVHAACGGPRAKTERSSGSGEKKTWGGTPRGGGLGLGRIRHIRRAGVVIAFSEITEEGEGQSKGKKKGKT